MGSWVRPTVTRRRTRGIPILWRFQTLGSNDHALGYTVIQIILKRQWLDEGLRHFKASAVEITIGITLVAITSAVIS
jgi:hypothetical protein